jgi:dTDP-4-amino-4,6-dideoxygalactose transaminase
MSQHGLSRGAWSRYQRPGVARYEVLLPGFKYNMSDLQAAIGLHQLRALDRHLARRDAIARRYDAAFADLPLGRFAGVPYGTVHARHLYTVLVEPRPGRDRDDVAAALAEAGVASSVHFPVIHLQRYYAEKFGYAAGRFPHAERIAATVLSLPMSPAHADSQIDQVIRAVRDVVGG